VLLIFNGPVCADDLGNALRVGDRTQVIAPLPAKFARALLSGRLDHRDGLQTQEAAKGRRQDFERYLNAVPDEVEKG
jgi:hypothetical protein